MAGGSDVAASNVADGMSPSLAPAAGVAGALTAPAAMEAAIQGQPEAMG